MGTMMIFKVRLRWLALLAGLILISPGPADSVVPEISFYRLAGGLALPVHITHAGDGSGRLFVVEQPGRIRIIRNGLLQSVPFLDITSRVLSGGERGLLSVAFPPSFLSKGYFYVFYVDLGGNLRISRFFVTANPDVANPASEGLIISIPHPTFSNHNGGQLAFGPDGFLYLGTGDGGGGGDPANNGQNTAALLGKILRLDVESGVVPYAIPPGNPFVGNPSARGEIWAYGLRNPFRFSFDRLTGDLYIGDVGQNLLEELDFQPAASSGGENYGWRIMEGTLCFNPPSSCSTSGLTPPVFVYDHVSGDCAIIGGFVYRGQVSSEMRGLYLYGDQCSGRLWGFRNPGTSQQNALLFDTPFLLTSFGEDQAGQLYTTNYITGEIFRIGTPGTVAGDFNADSRTDFAFLNAVGDVFYSPSPGAFVNVPGSLAHMVAGDFSGTGRSGIAGLRVDGSVLISTDLLSFSQIPMTLSSLVSGDFNGNGTDDLAGLALDGTIWVSTNLASFSQIPGTPGTLVHLISGDFDGNGRDDLAGLGPDGSIFYTTDLATWTNIPGSLSLLVSGHFNTLRPGDQLAGLALDGTIRLSTDLAAFSTTIPGTLKHLISGDFNSDGRDDLAGIGPDGSAFFSTDLANWTNIPGPGFLTQVASGNFNGTAPDDLVGTFTDGSRWLTIDRATWTLIGPVPGQCHNPAVRIGGTSAYFSTIQLALDSATAGQSVQAQALDLAGDLNMINNIAVTLTGGYSCDYSSNPGFTTVHGTAVFSSGTVTIGNIIIL